MLWRLWRRPRPAPDLPLSRDDVIARFDPLADITTWTLDIWRIVGGEENDQRLFGLL
jgi:hypothetical protein